MNSTTGAAVKGAVGVLMSRRRFFSRLYQPVAGAVGAGLFLRRFYLNLLKGLGGVKFVPYIGVDREVDLGEIRLDSGNSYWSAEFKGFHLVINYVELVANIWHHKIGSKQIYDHRVTRTLNPVYEGINDFLITGISKALVERLDPTSDIFKLLLLKEGLQVIVTDQLPPDGEPWPRSYRVGKKKFIKRVAIEIPNQTGFKLTINGNKENG